MDNTEYSQNLGKLVSNLLSLEFGLRLFLRINEIPKGASLFEKKINSLKEGDTILENAFTNYDSLSKLIDKYNCHLGVLSAGLTIDKNLSCIRDAIAHGRVSSNNPNEEMTLLKFSNPNKNGKVTVTFCATLTNDWFREQIKKVYDAVSKVREAIDKFQNNKL
jgi:hypothetical protein